MICLVVAQLVRAPAREAGDSGSNPSPGENFSLKLSTNKNVIILIN